MMDFLAREAVVIQHFEPRPGIPPSVTATMNMALAQGLPLSGYAYPTEWAQFQPGAPWFAIPKRGPRPWPFPMLVEFDDG